MAQKVQFIVTVLHRPKLLIFDEPFSGFDPINANLLRDEILRLKDEGATIIFSTHNMSSVEEICDHITLINSGRNILTGNVADIRRDFTRGRYSLTFTGSPEALIQAISPMLADYTFEPAASGRQCLNLRLDDCATLRELIARANDTVDIASINEALASMNQIFIQAVQSATPNC